MRTLDPPTREPLDENIMPLPSWSKSAVGNEFEDATFADRLFFG